MIKLFKLSSSADTWGGGGGEWSRNIPEGQEAAGDRWDWVRAQCPEGWEVMWGWQPCWHRQEPVNHSSVPQPAHSWDNRWCETELSITACSAGGDAVPVDRVVPTCCCRRPAASQLTMALTTLFPLPERWEWGRLLHRPARRSTLEFLR